MKTECLGDIFSNACLEIKVNNKVVDKSISLQNGMSNVNKPSP